jgi:hypothetical protein
MLQLAKHVHAKFQLSSFYPDELRQHFDQNFLKKIKKKKNAILKKNPNRHRNRHLSPKLKPSSIFTKSIFASETNAFHISYVESKKTYWS